MYATQRNRFFLGDTLEILAPEQKPFVFKPELIWNENNEEIDTVNHAMMKFRFKCEIEFPPRSIIRKQL